MSKQYVIDTMKELLDCKRGADFAREMGVSRQALNSYKNSNADRITDRIVDRLLKQVEKRDQFIDRLKGRLKAIEDVAGEN